jgi:hypothetical protein
MPVIASVANPNARRPVRAAALPSDACARIVTAKLVSLNGGIVLALCILVSALAVGSALVTSYSATETILFVLLAFASWIYLIDAVTEKLVLKGDAIVLSSAVGAPRTLKLENIRLMTLRHEGLNASIGIESLTVVTADGKSDRLPLGPCWRRRELEAFLMSVSGAMGVSDVVDIEG